MLLTRLSTSTKLDFPDAFGPMSTLSGRSSSGGVSGANESRPLGLMLCM